MIDDIVREVFANLLDLTEPIDWPSIRYQEVAGWDSVAHMAIVAELEDRLGIMLDIDDIIDMSSVSASIEILKKYGDSKA